MIPSKAAYHPEITKNKKNGIGKKFHYQTFNGFGLTIINKDSEIMEERNNKNQEKTRKKIEIGQKNRFTMSTP